MKRIKYFIKIIFSIVLLIILFLHINFNEFKNAITTIKTSALVIAVIIYVGLYYFWNFVLISLDNVEDKYDDVQIELDEMISALDKHGIRLLVTIDEVSNSKEMRTFAGAFQIFLRHDLPLFLLMTGLWYTLAPSPV